VVMENRRRIKRKLKKIKYEIFIGTDNKATPFRNARYCPMFGFSRISITNAPA
jgi:hypothetical protein